MLLSGEVKKKFVDEIALMLVGEVACWCNFINACHALGIYMFLDLKEHKSAYLIHQLVEVPTRIFPLV